MKAAMRNSYGWSYLISGLVLTVAAIVLPAHHDLAELQQKKAAIAEDYADLNQQIVVHQNFLKDLMAEDPKLHDRIVRMQFNQAATGVPVVIDRAAAKTPLDWVAQRARQTRIVDIDTPRDSILTTLTNGRNRLWLAGAGVFVIFIGLVVTPACETESPITE